MANCCGQERVSRFCPECGEKLQEHPLESLLAHARREVAKNEKRLQTLRNRIARQAETPGWKHYTGLVGEKDLAGPDRLADRWKSWADALDDLMKRPPPP